MTPLDAKIVRAPATGREWRGRVTLVDFWEYTCINCIRTLPYVNEWHRRYRDRGLAVVGVHAPEFPFTRSRENVEAAAREFGIEYEIVLDNDYRIWNAFANRAWPAKYLVDHEGYIRYRRVGEGGYEQTEAAIRQLLHERDPNVQLPPSVEPLRAIDRVELSAVCERPTPEIHLGAGAAQPDGLTLCGEWLRTPDCAVVGGGPARLRLVYSAAEVNLVMAGDGEIELIDNGAPVDHQSRGADVRELEDGRTVVQADRPRMYRLIQRDRFLTRTLEISSRSAGLELYAFSFATCIPRP